MQDLLTPLDFLLGSSCLVIHHLCSIFIAISQPSCEVSYVVSLNKTDNNGLIPLVVGCCYSPSQIFIPPFFSFFQYLIAFSFHAGIKLTEELLMLERAT